MPEKRHRVPPSQTIRARELRREMTIPERLLWGRLRRGGVGGLKFRRQCPIGPFIVDFYCASKSLVVEADGVSHDGREKSDAERTAYLGDRGLRVIRYTNDEIIQSPDAVVEDIARHAGVDL